MLGRACRGQHAWSSTEGPTPQAFRRARSCSICNALVAMGSADPNPSWTRAPWAGVPQPASMLSGVGARAAPPHAARPGGDGEALADAARMPPPPPRLPSRPSATLAEQGWQAFFDTAVDVRVGQDVFRVYMVGRAGPLVLCLHGAGCTALSFAAAAPALAAAANCRVAALVRLEESSVRLRSLTASLRRTCAATEEAAAPMRTTFLQRRASPLRRFFAHRCCSPLSVLCAEAGS